MGSCFSSEKAGDGEERKRSQMIDKTLYEDARKLRRECKILLLGLFVCRGTFCQLRLACIG